MTRGIVRRYALSRISLLVVIGSIAACGSGGGGGGGGGGAGGGAGGGGTGGGAGNPNLQATFASIQDNVFTPICVACHVGASAPVGLRLDQNNSYALLVGVASTEVPALLRVAAGNPNNSYLIQKLEGTAAVGGRMPLGGTPLPQADINMIRQWITDGAQAPPAPPATNPIRVTSLSPLPASSLTALPSSITAVFDRQPDAATVNATTVLVDRSGGDGTFADGNEVAITAASVTVPMANTSSVVFDLAGVTNVEDTYRIRLIGAGAANIQDLDSNALDGEFSGTFPSGNATAGGDFVAQFVVAGTQPTLQSIQTNVFTPRCAGCHTGPTSNFLPGGMDLTSANASFTSLVGVASLEVPALQRVRVGDPTNSYLI
ncbi:MAG TPA: Ig-like domain-containing protein, partial [Gammaproteobacteria bacterium]|nr:Ig-like domain-containing protein [Gammaproteobacteria bacterium]